MRMKIARPSERTAKAIFVLFVAMNALGYNDENNPRGMSKERRMVRQALPRRSLRRRYAALARHMRKEHPWHLIHKVLLGKKNDTVSSDLRKFTKEPEVKILWRTLWASLMKRERILAPIFKREATRLIAFLEREPRSIKQATLIFNPLDAYWRGYGFTVRNTGYVVTGPGTKSEVARLVRHELLHFLAPRISIPPRFTSPKAHRRRGNEGYGDRAVMAREYVVRGLGLLYEREALHRNITPALRREEKRFPHTRAILALLEK